MIKVKPGMIVGGTVLRIFKTYLIVDLGRQKGLVHTSEVSDYALEDLTTFFAVGEHYLWSVLSVEEGGSGVRLSWKAITPRYRENPFQFTLRPTPLGFEQLTTWISKVSVKGHHD